MLAILCSLQLDGDLLMRLGRNAEAIATYKRILVIASEQPVRVDLPALCLPACGEMTGKRKSISSSWRERTLLCTCPTWLWAKRRPPCGDLIKAQPAYSLPYALAPNKLAHRRWRNERRHRSA